MAINRQFKILSATTIAALETEVETYFKQGWILAGGLSINQNPMFLDSDGCTEVLYCVAIQKGD